MRAIIVYLVAPLAQSLIEHLKGPPCSRVRIDCSSHCSKFLIVLGMVQDIFDEVCISHTKQSFDGCCRIRLSKGAFYLCNAVLSKEGLEAIAIETRSFIDNQDLW